MHCELRERRARHDNGKGGGTDQADLTKTVRGTLPTGSPDFVYLPVEVPRGVREIAVSYTYEKTPVPAGTQGNALDIGIFDERGTELGGRGFRGWSGGARTELLHPGGRGDARLCRGSGTGRDLAHRAGPVHRRARRAPVRGDDHPPLRRARHHADARVPARARQGPGPRLVPRRLPSALRPLGRQAHPRRDRHAARAAGLDFINSSEHNTHAAHSAWQGLWGDDLLILTGEEITTRNGHVIALATDPGTFVDWRYRARDNRFGHYAKAVRRAGGLVVPAHPHATCIGCHWKFGFGEADAVEVWNGPYTPEDEIALAEWDNSLVAAVRASKPWVPAMGNSDAHREPDKIGAAADRRPRRGALARRDRRGHPVRALVHRRVVRRQPLLRRLGRAGRARGHR